MDLVHRWGAINNIELLPQRTVPYGLKILALGHHLTDILRIGVLQAASIEVLAKASCVLSRILPAIGESHQPLLSAAAPREATPYSFSLLCKVFRLMPSISAARVLLLWVDSNVFRIRRRSASSTVVPTPTRTAFPSLTWPRIGAWPKPGGMCFGSIIALSQTITARSSRLRNSR